MKNIIMLEDNPVRLKKFIDHTNQGKMSEGIDIEQVLYYNPNLEQTSEEVTELKKELKVDVTVVNLWNFDEILNDLYAQENNLFIFDTDLNEKLEENVFSYRINVSYAMRKKEKDRIWFYTAAGPDFERNIAQTFSGYVIPVYVDEDQQLDLKWRECESFQKAISEAGGVQVI